MNIAYFIDTVLPSKRANTVHVMRMCQAFAKEGNQVTLFCDKERDIVEKAAIWKQYGIETKFSIEQTYLNPNFLKYGHRLAIMVNAYKRTKGVRNYDLVYGRSVYSLFYIRNKCKYIYETHISPDAFTRCFEKSVIYNPNCLGLVVISDELKKEYMRLFPKLSPEKILVLHDAADPVEERKDEGCITDVRPVIGYLGHLYPGKCMEVLMPLAKERPEYKFHIVGGTEDWIEHWKKELREKKIENIIFYGFVNNADIGRYYNSFDICILPFSESVYVGKNKNADIGRWISPLKLFEAMAYGKAILVSDIPTIREVIDDNKTGMLAKPNKLTEWKEKLDILVKDSEKRDKLGMYAKEEFLKNYTWEIRAKKVLEYVKLVYGIQEI